jgi:CheB methylesterase
MGLVMAQDPRSARYPRMPARAIATRLVDYVLPASKMARTLVSYLKGPYYNQPGGFRSDPAAASSGDNCFDPRSHWTWLFRI